MRLSVRLPNAGSSGSGLNSGLRITHLIHTTAISETMASTTPALAKIGTVISGLGDTCQMAKSMPAMPNSCGNG
ncbi:hypothetical protein D3C81_2233350 [compost metagenome]